MGMVTKWVRLPTAWVEAASLVVCHSLPPRPTPTELYQQTQAATKSWQQYLQGEHQAWQGECFFFLANTIFFHFFPKTKWLTSRDDFLPGGLSGAGCASASLGQNFGLCDYVCAI